MEFDNETLADLNSEEAKQYIGGFVFVSVIMVIGIVGNVHVLLVYSLFMKPSNHRIFILVLGVLDFITCIVGMPFILVDLRHPLTFTLVTPCKILRFINYFICSSSALILVVIATERYKKICGPHSKQLKQRDAGLLCVLVLGIALFMSWPAPILYGVASVPTSYHNITGSRCYTEDKKNFEKYQGYFNAGLILIIFSAFIVLVVLYSLIWRAVAKNSRIQKLLKGKGQLARKKAATGDLPSDGKDSFNGVDSNKSIVDLPSDGKHSFNGVDSNKSIVDLPSDGKDSFNGVDSNKSIVDLPSDGKDSFHGVDSSKDDSCVFSIENSGSNTTTDTSTTNSFIQQPVTGSARDNNATTVSQQQSSYSRAKRTTLMFLLITAVFFLSYMPHLLLKLLTFFKHDFVHSLSFEGKLVYNTVVWSFFINNMANCFVYGFYDMRFRRALINIYGKLCVRA